MSGFVLAHIRKDISGLRVAPWADSERRPLPRRMYRASRARYVIFWSSERSPPCRSFGVTNREIFWLLKDWEISILAVGPRSDRSPHIDLIRWLRILSYLVAYHSEGASMSPAVVWSTMIPTLPRFSPPAPSPQAPPPALSAASDLTTVPLVCAHLRLRARAFVRVEYWFPQYAKKSREIWY